MSDATNPNTPEESTPQELLAGYVLGDLTPEEMAQVQELLREDPALATEVLQLQNTLGAIPLALEFQQPPAHVKAQLLATAASAAAPAKKVSQPWRLPWGRIITGIAITGAIALGLQNWQLRQQLAQSAPYKIAITTDDRVPQDSWQAFGEVFLDHQDSLSRSEGPVDFGTQDVAQMRQQYGERVDMSGKFPELKRAKLLGGSFCELSKTEGVRLSYKVSAGQTISFYRLDREGFSLKISDRPMPIQMFEGPNGLVWGDRDYVYVLVGEVPMGTIRQLWRSLDSV